MISILKDLSFILTINTDSLEEGKVDYILTNDDGEEYTVGNMDEFVKVTDAIKVLAKFGS